MAAVVDGIVYLFGGVSQGTGTYCSHTSTLAYDPDQDLFTGRRRLPAPCAAAACAAIGGKIYIAAGRSGYPPSCSGASHYNSLWVFDPQGGLAPQILSFNREANDTVRLRWQGEAGRSYAVEYTVNVAVKGPWPRFKFSAGDYTVRATNEVVEVTGAVLPADTARFFRVLEAD